MQHKFVKIKQILYQTSYTNQPLIIKEKKDKLTIHYLNKYQNNKLKTKRFQPKRAIIPKKIKLTKELVECIGLYQGDGQKSTNSKSYQAVRFSNSEPPLIKKFIKFLNIFGIKNKDLKVYIRIRTKKTKEFSEEEIIDHWHKITKIPKKNFYKLTWVQVKGKKYYKKGNATIIYMNSSFRVIFDSLFYYIKKLSLKDNEIAAHFLRGLIAADGNVYFKGTSREVNIAAKNEIDRLFIKKLFALLKIVPNKDNLTKGKETVRITGYPNFEIIQKHTLCDLHPNKKETFIKLINSYKNICYRKETCVPLILKLLKTKQRTVKELSNLLERKPNTIRRYLYQLEKQGKLKRNLNKREFQTGRLKELWHLI